MILLWTTDLRSDHKFSSLKNQENISKFQSESEEIFDILKKISKFQSESEENRKIYF